MTEINHHIPDDVLDTYRAGTLPHAFAVVVAAHLSLCDECRARIEAADMIGGVLLNGAEGVALLAGARDRMMAALDAPPPPPLPPRRLRPQLAPLPGPRRAPRRFSRYAGRCSRPSFRSRLRAPRVAPPRRIAVA